MKDRRYVMTTTTSEPFDVPVRAVGNLNIQVGEMAPGTITGVVAANGIIGQNAPKDTKSGPIYAKQFINAFFGFDKPGHLFTFASEGPAVGKKDDYDRVKQLAGSHPEWTETQVIATLLKAGALYGPDGRDKFLRTIPIEGLEKLFGKIAIVSTEFESLTQNSTPRFALLYWVVTIKVSFPDGGEGTYTMHFEPFNGALIQMEAVSPGGK
jgi:hypothetical protein